MIKSIAFIGTGISGLSAAHFFRKRFPESTVYLIESADHVGGNFNSEKTGQFLFEFGPRGVLKTSHAFFHLLHSANLWNHLIAGKKTSSKRFVWYENKLQKLGGNPLKFLFSPIMKGVLRSVWNERNLRNKSESEDETLQQFFERRFGKQITHNLLDAFINGVWAGDISKLSAKSVFPSLVDGEKEFGSVVKGFLKTKKQRKEKSEIENAEFIHPQLPEGRFFSVQNGLQNLAELLAEPFKKNILLSHQITHIEKIGIGWEITFSDTKKISVEHLVFSTPAYVTGNLLRQVDHQIFSDLVKIDYVPVAVVNIGYENLKSDTDGFGFLIPFNQNKRILGVIFNSGTFDHVAPESGKNFTVMLGGAHHEEVFSQTEEQIQEIAVQALNEFLNINQKPDFVKVKKWQHAIPQYNVGHSDLVRKIAEQKATHLNLHLLGSWKDGIGINDCVKSSYNWAKNIDA